VESASLLTWRVSVTSFSSIYRRDTENTEKSSDKMDRMKMDFQLSLQSCGSCQRVSVLLLSVFSVSPW